RVKNEQAPAIVFPRRIERHAKPAPQPIERFGRDTLDVEEHLRGRDAFFDRREDAFEVREQAIEEARRLGVLAIYGRQVLVEIREARIPRAQGTNSRRAAAVAVQHKPDLQVPSARALEQQFPRSATVAVLSWHVWQLGSVASQIR